MRNVSEKGSRQYARFFFSIQWWKNASMRDKESDVFDISNPRNKWIEVINPQAFDFRKVCQEPIQESV
jgi:hypothetical protein